jgi:hypothetical protein
MTFFFFSHFCRCHLTSGYLTSVSASEANREPPVQHRLMTASAGSAQGGRRVPEQECGGTAGGAQNSRRLQDAPSVRAAAQHWQVPGHNARHCLLRHAQVRATAAPPKHVQHHAVDGGQSCAIGQVSRGMRTWDLPNLHTNVTMCFVKLELRARGARERPQCCSWACFLEAHRWHRHS